MKRIGENEKKYVLDILDNDISYKIDKKYVRLFEEEFAKKIGMKYGISVVNGTATMHAILKGMNIGHGDEVIVPPLTMMSTTLAVLQANALPVFADVDNETFQISIDSIKKCITKRTKAILVVSLYGLCPEMDEIMEIAKDNNLFVIEDNAECLLGYYKGKIVGSIGHASSFSLQNSKHITAGEGGMILTNDINLAHNIRRFTILGYKSIGELAPPNLTIKDFQHPNFHRHMSFGYNYRITGMAAAVGLGQLEKCEQLVEWRQKCANIFINTINENNCKWLTCQKTPNYCINSFWTLACKLETNLISWYEFKQKFIENGGESFYAAWIPSHLETFIIGKKIKDYQWQNLTFGLCPIAEKLQKQMIQFKTNYLNDDDINFQANALKKTIIYFNEVLSNKKNKIFGVISCRLNSTRLPLKGILDINGKESILRCIDNIKNTSGIDTIIVATTTEKEDDKLEEIILNKNINIFRGSNNNVIKRIIDALESYGANDDDIIIRGMADDVCVSSDILDLMIASHKENNADVTLCYPKLYPSGITGEVYSFKALKKMQKILDFEETEYITFFYLGFYKLFNINVIKLPYDYECDWDLTLDYSEELEIFRNIYKQYSNFENITFNMLKHYFNNNPKTNERIIGLGNDANETLKMLNNKCKSINNFINIDNMDNRIIQIYNENNINNKIINTYTYDGKNINIKT